MLRRFLAQYGFTTLGHICTLGLIVAWAMALGIALGLSY